MLSLMAPGRLASWLMVAVAVTACSTPGSTANRSPSSGHGSQTPTESATAQPSSSPTPQAVSVPYGVLVSSQAANSYSVSIVSVDGKVVATSEASTPLVVSCANAAGAPVPLPVSISNSRVYYMDAQGVIRFIAPGGDSGRATTVPAGTASRRSMFAVSPDDQRIAVIVNDYTSSGASMKLYVEDVNGGGNHIDLYSQTGARTLWPIGWHTTNNLVVAVVPSCTQGGGPFCCGIQELHVVDPATANRRFTLGAITSCPIAGPPSPSGAVCEDVSNLGAKILNWTAGTSRSFRIGSPAPAFLSPDGSHVALWDNNGTFIEDTSKSLAGMFACTWIDDSHVLSGGDPQHQPRIADVSTGTMIPVAAQGDCGGRLPGGL
ncbi:MAG TPA: hypothetical protein VJP81_11350 [Candidatus Dormibacteraeota bacterium]|nr:hypothetical protein [Candidatus Dormibacteraeota bacterium]